MDSSNTAGPSRARQQSKSSPVHPQKKPAASVGDGIPGVSKLKSQIRQTTRLLAKDTLEPQLRIATERRLASLQADLAKAQTRGIEQKNGEKYHMVKFFERKKLLRIVNRTQKQLSTLPNSEALAEPSTDVKSKQTSKKNMQDSEREQLEAELWEARVMLNYILHYSNLRKYISLFPAAQSDSSDEHQLVLPRLLHPTTASEDALDETSKSRLQMLRKVESLMKSGEVSSTPEIEVAEKGNKRKVGGVDIVGQDEEEVEEKATSVAAAAVDEPSKKKQKKSRAEADVKAKPADAEDDFFE